MTAVGRRAVLSMMAGGTLLAAHTAGRSQPLVDGSDPRIRHIVVLMLENRSFDHMLGLLTPEIPGLRGVAAGQYVNEGADGARYHVGDGAKYQGQLVIDPPHEFEHVN